MCGCHSYLSPAASVNLRQRLPLADVSSVTRIEAPDFSPDVTAITAGSPTPVVSKPSSMG